MRNQVPTVRREGGRNDRPEREEGLFSEQVLWEYQCFVADLLFARRSDAVDFARCAARDASRIAVPRCSTARALR